MNYRVIYTDSFQDDLRDHLAYLRSQKVDEDVIEDWYTKLFDKLDSLDEWPRAYRVSESYTADSGLETHKYNFGDYLVFYQINDQQERVELVAFMHGANRR